MQKDTKGHEKSFIALSFSYPCWLEHRTVLASHSLEQCQDHAGIPGRRAARTPPCLGYSTPSRTLSGPSGIRLN